ncbi:hypothetical protein NDU88_001335 [Pleurodeles waltl]|uniref:Uncharacterized protein n=1 Tax=Pleurodeles waltl TaxID=8319 RepID=A0AAV7W165_PLEWA|nr:hypothetical protein NDU88_001335 [Pleurodeles waltl]
MDAPPGSTAAALALASFEWRPINVKVQLQNCSCVTKTGKVRDDETRKCVKASLDCTLRDRDCVMGHGL